MNRSRLVLVVILVAVATLLGSLWVGEGPLWRWVMLVEEEWSSSIGEAEIRGLVSRHRWKGTRHGSRGAWYVESGYLANQAAPRGLTHWGPDGVVLGQIFVEGNGDERIISSPPWLWGVTDQTEPTAPWWGKE